MKANKEYIKQLLHEKEQVHKSEASMLALFLFCSALSFVMLIFYSYFQYSKVGFELNFIFKYALMALILASGFLFISTKNYREDNLRNGLTFLLFSFGNTLFFCFLQVKAWNLLKSTYTGTPQQTGVFLSFIILSSYHFFHVVAGVIFQMVLIAKHFNTKIHSKALNLIKFATYYWYFVTIVGLIIYLLYV